MIIINMIIIYFHQPLCQCFKIILQVYQQNYNNDISIYTYFVLKQTPLPEKQLRIFLS